MNTKTKLVMTFKTEDDKKVSLSVDDPRINLTEQEIVDVMELIVSKNVFAPSGTDIVAPLEAKIVKTNTSEYDLVV